MLDQSPSSSHIKSQSQQLSTKYQSAGSRPPRIGSIKNNKVNYISEEQFFTKEDMFAYARTMKSQVQQFLDPDYMQLRKAKWNASVEVPKKFQDEETPQQKLFKIRKGFADTTPPIPYRAPKMFQGTESRDDFSNWNISNQIERKQLKENYSSLTKSAMQNSKTKQGRYLQSYLTPLTKTVHLIQGEKDKEKQDTQRRAKIRAGFLFQNPEASEDRTRAAVFRLAHQTAIKKRNDDIAAQSLKLDFKANLSSLQKSKISLQYHHSGIWQLFRDQTWAWSCCQNQQQLGRGCVITKRDRNKWNLCSFTG